MNTALQRSEHPAAIDTALAERLLSVALAAGGDFAEIFNEYRRDRSISLEDGQVRSTAASIVQGVAIRVQIGEATGHAFCESGKEEDMIAAARLASRIARQGGEAPALSAWQADQPQAAYYRVDEDIAAADVSSRVALLRRAEQHANSCDARISFIGVTVLDTERWIQVFASDGTCAADYQPMLAMRCSVVLRDGARQERGYCGRGGRAGMEFLQTHSPEDIAAEAVRMAQFLLTAEPCPAGSMPVVMGPGHAGVLIHEAVGHGLEGDFNRRNLSAYSGRVGEQVASDLCTIIDDGTVPGDRGALHIDDEGTPSERSVLIENGRLQGYMQDKLNARLMGVPLTGNGRRESYKSPTIPRMRVTSLAPGPHDPDEIIASVDKGLYAKSFGGGSVDITKGDYNFEVIEAYLIEDGKLTKPVRGATLVGNGPETLQAVSMVAGDLQLQVNSGFCGKEGQRAPVGYGTPTMKVDSLVVGGTA